MISTYTDVFYHCNSTWLHIPQEQRWDYGQEKGWPPSPNHRMWKKAKEELLGEGTWQVDFQTERQSAENSVERFLKPVWELFII